MTAPARQIADLADAAVMQIALGHFADAGDLAHVERSQEARLAAREDPQNAVGLGLIRGDLGDQARRRRADRAVQIGRAVHGVVQRVRGGERRPEQAFGAGQIEIGFVDRGHLDTRRELLQHLVDFARIFDDSARDGLRRRSPAGTICRRSAAAWPNERRTCAPRKMRPRPRRARWICRRRRPVCL